MKQLSPLFALTFILLFNRPCFGFINIESLRQNLKEGLYGSTGINASGASGNSRTFKMGLNSQNIFKGTNKEFILISNYKYGEASRLKNTNKGSFHLRYAQRFLTATDWEIFTQAEFNEFQSLELRTLAGLGLRTRLFKTDHTSLFLGSGAFYEDEKIKVGANQANFRGNLYLSFRNSTNENTEIILVGYYQPSFKSIDDYRLQLTAGLEVKINELLSLVNSFHYQRDSRPPTGIEKEDIGYSVGFNLSY